MSRITLSARVGSDGVLHLPLGREQANREVRVTIESADAHAAEPRQAYLEFLRATAGAWQGEFERPAQGEYEVRDPLE